MLDLENQTNINWEETIKNLWDEVTKSDFKELKLGIDEMSVARAFVYLCSQIFWEDFHYPQPIKGVYDIANSYHEKLKWAYRSWFNQLQVAERNSGIESFLHDQVLDFSLPENFIESSKASLASAGDLLAVDVLTEENTKHLFDDIKDFYFSADITCANLESTVYSEAPFGRNQVTGEPAKMNTSEGMLDRFIDNGNGINYFTTANNHSYDYKEEGLLATLDLLDKNQVYHSGTNRTPEQQEDVLIIEQNGIKIAMLSYTCDMNGNKYDKKYLINEVRFNDETVDLSLVRRQIKRAHEKGADFIVASCHWGWEFEMYPHENIMEAAHTLIEEGIDVILGDHPHVSQPMERYEYEKDNEKKQGLIVYSFGDFVSYHPESKNSKITYVARFDIVKGMMDDKPAAFLTNLKMHPIYILNAKRDDGSYDCRLLKFRRVLEDTGEGGSFEYGLTDEEREDLKRLRDEVLYGILLPEKYEDILEL